MIHHVVSKLSPPIELGSVGAITYHDVACLHFEGLYTEYILNMFNRTVNSAGWLTLTPITARPPHVYIIDFNI